MFPFSRSFLLASLPGLFLILYLLLFFSLCCCSFTESWSSPTLWPHGLQYGRPPCPSWYPGVCSHSCRLSQWCYLTISFSATLFSFCLQSSVFPSIRVFSHESALHIRSPKYWNFSFNINPSNEYSGLISFRVDWFDLLAVQRTLKSLLQHHSLKASILWHPAFFMIQLSHLYMTWKPQLWLYGPLLAKWCLCFLIHCLGLL